MHKRHKQQSTPLANNDSSLNAKHKKKQTIVVTNKIHTNIARHLRPHNINNQNKHEQQINNKQLPCWKKLYNQHCKILIFMLFFILFFWVFLAFFVSDNSSIVRTEFVWYHNQSSWCIFTVIIISVLFASSLSELLTLTVALSRNCFLSIWCCWFIFQNFLCNCIYHCFFTCNFTLPFLLFFLVFFLLLWLTIKSIYSIRLESFRNVNFLCFDDRLFFFRFQCFFSFSM